MALKGLDIFKLSPKKNCKECGCPTCMAFCMKVAQGALSLDKCPHFSPEAIATLSEATAPAMKTIKVGDHKLGGETVLFRHEKTFVSKNLFAVPVCTGMEPADIDAKLAEVAKVDYERIGERMYVEFIFVHDCGKGADKVVDAVKKVEASGRCAIVETEDPEVAKAVVEVTANAIIVGATAENWEAMNAAVAGKAVLGVKAPVLADAYDVIAKLEGKGNKNLVVDCTGATIKDTFANTVLLRRTAIKDGDRTCGYPSIVNLTKIAKGDIHLQTALAATFTVRYGSIIVMEKVSYAEALPLYGLRQNVYTDPQKPMKVAPGIYPLNGADENSICATTVDFALTYFVVSGEMERSGVPVNLLISDAGGYSVLTAWAAGKLSASSIAKFIEEQGIESKIKNRILILPGKVAVLKGELEAKLPDWKIVVGPNEAVQLVKFLRDLTA